MFTGMFTSLLMRATNVIIGIHRKFIYLIFVKQLVVILVYTIYYCNDIC